MEIFIKANENHFVLKPTEKDPIGLPYCVLSANRALFWGCTFYNEWCKKQKIKILKNEFFAGLIFAIGLILKHFAGLFFAIFPKIAKISPAKINSAKLIPQKLIPIG